MSFTSGGFTNYIHSTGSETGNVGEFIKVTASMTKPSSPQEYEIWLECDDVINKIHFADVDPSSIIEGDVVIGISGIREVLANVIKFGNTSLSTVPSSVRPSNKKVFTSELVTIWGDIGSAKVKRVNSLSYVNGFIYTNGEWVQFSIDSNVGFIAGWSDMGLNPSTYVVVKYNNLDERTQQNLARWNNYPQLEQYGFPSYGILYDPIRRMAIGASIQAKLFEFNVDKDFNSATNRTDYINFDTSSITVANSRDFIVAMNNVYESGSYRTNIMLWSTENKDKILAYQDPVLSSGNKHPVSNRLVKYAENDKVLLSYNQHNSQGTITGYDMSRVISDQIVDKLFQLNLQTDTVYSGAYTMAITVNKEGLTTLFAPWVKEFRQISIQGELVRTVQPSGNLDLVNPASTRPVIYAITEDQHGDFYICGHTQNAPTMTLMKLDKDFKKIWEIKQGFTVPELHVTKEGILYAWGSNNNIIQKIDAKSGDIISIVYNKATYATSATYDTMFTLSPSISAFPEYW